MEAEKPPEPREKTDYEREVEAMDSAEFSEHMEALTGRPGQSQVSLSDGMKS
jgi:hypothetical protein